jgi:hypothetical protein
MEKLTLENIAFIDNYLKNSGVTYLDIRMEMTDHIASEIENRIEKGGKRGFYPIFKDYMLDHKTALLKNYNRFKIKVTKKMAIKVFHNLYHPKVLLFALLATAAVYLFPGFFADYWLSLHLVFAWGIILFYFLPRFFFDKTKYSHTHLLMFIWGTVNYLVSIKFPFKDLSMGFIFWHAVILCWGNAAMLKAVLDMKNHYKKQFRLS